MAAQSPPGLLKGSHTCRYTNVGELTKAIQIMVFGGRGNVTQQGDLGTFIKIKFSPPPRSLNLVSLSLLHISVCSKFPCTFSSFLSLSTFLGFLLPLFPPILLFSPSGSSFTVHHRRDPLLLLARALAALTFQHKTGSLKQFLSFYWNQNEIASRCKWNPVFAWSGGLFLLHLLPLWSSSGMKKRNKERQRWGRVINASDEAATLHREKDSWHSSVLQGMTGWLP